MKTLLVTGVSGLLGGNIARSLMDRGYRVRALLREGYDRRTTEGLDLDVTTGDVTDANSVSAAMEGVDGVIHSAGYVHFGWSGGETHRRVNTGGTKIVAVAARDCGLRMVHVSTADTMGLGQGRVVIDEESSTGGVVLCPYVTSKRAAEEAVLAQCGEGLSAIVVNPAYMLGPWDWKPSSGRMLVTIGKHPPLVCPGGGHSFCDARDVAEATVNALESDIVGRRFLLGGENVEFIDAWRLFAEVAGKRGPRFRLGPMLPTIGGLLGDGWGKLAGKEPDLNSAAAQSARKFHWYSSARAEAELGYRRRPLRETVEDAWTWFQNHGYV